VSFTEAYLRDAHKHCSNHRAELEASKDCGCFYCLKVYGHEEIEDWLEEATGDFANQRDSWTAFCPKCAIDSVIGDASGFPVSDPAFLDAMHEFWFERTVTIDEVGKIIPDENPKSLLARMRGWLTQKTA
jgi:hypothetical protein